MTLYQVSLADFWTRPKIYLLSRSIICAVVVISIGTLFLRPGSLLQYILDTLLRTYLMFIGTVMAHEGVHGHLGRTRAANFRWGRFALLPTMVPFTNFRKTHHLHHAYTNIPGKDPDHFMKSRNLVELVLARPGHAASMVLLVMETGSHQESGFD